MIHQLVIIAWCHKRIFFGFVMSLCCIIVMIGNCWFLNGTAILELRPYCFSTVGVDSKDDLVKNKFGEYGEMQKGWTAEDAKGFIKVLSTPLRAYYANHKDEADI